MQVCVDPMFLVFGFVPMAASDDVSDSGDGDAESENGDRGARASEAVRRLRGGRGGKEDGQLVPLTRKRGSCPPRRPFWPRC
jgi:hypothetical protein